MYQSQEAIELIETLKKYKAADPAHLLHPYFLNPHPETLLIQDLESVWQPITLRDDWSVFEGKIQRIRAFRGVYRATATSKHSEVF